MLAKLGRPALPTHPNRVACVDLCPRYHCRVTLEDPSKAAPAIKRHAEAMSAPPGEVNQMTEDLGRRNPTGIVRTPDELDESVRESYWHHAIEYGVEYYVSGRFASASGFIPVAANLLHHGAELLLKACLAHDDSADVIRRYGSKSRYGHDLVRLWEEFKRRNGSPEYKEFDAIIAALQKFEDIRYPETLIQNGATIKFGLFDVENPIDGDNGRDTLYELRVPQVDRLMKVLFDASKSNPEVFLAQLDRSDERRRDYYDKLTTTLFGRAPAGA